MEQNISIPLSREGSNGKLTLGVRPEHVRFSDKATYRGRVTASEYLGTTQIVSVTTPNGDMKVRMSSATAVRDGEAVGLEFDARKLTIFENQKGKAISSEANEKVIRHG